LRYFFKQIKFVSSVLSSDALAEELVEVGEANGSASKN
jgi:hypothetical protein